MDINKWVEIIKTLQNMNITELVALTDYVDFLKQQIFTAEANVLKEANDALLSKKR